MNTSTHYELKLAEGTDLVNPLTIDVPNYQTIDSTMFSNEQAGVGSATELKSGTIHALTRTNQNRNVFTFKSTSVFNLGDTFTVDGGTVTALYPDGSNLKDRCFIVGSEILCMLDGSQLTVLAAYYPNAEDVTFNNSGTILSATDVQNALVALTSASNILYATGKNVKAKIDDITIASQDYTVSVSPNSTVTPFSYYGTANLTAFTGPYKPLAAVVLSTGSGQRAITNIKDDETTLYVYGTNSDDVKVRVIGIKR